MLKYFSMFSGIGGFELGINQAVESLRKQPRRKSVRPSRVIADAQAPDRRLLGAACIGYSEINAPAIKVYERHFHDHTNYGDATTINPEQLPDFDLVVGGFPCQAFSVAGKRRGFNETRGTLFFDIARILKHKRPRHLVLENVKGLLNHDGGKTFTVVLGVLTELGYDVEWQLFNSKDWGVPQNRERVYIVGHLRTECRSKIFPITREDEEAHHTSEHAPLGTEKFIKTRHLSQNGGLVSDNTTLQASEIPHIVRVREATKQGYAEATVGDSINISVPTSATRRGRVQKGLASTLQTGESMVTLQSDARIRRLTPVECERLQGFPETEESAIIEVCLDQQKSFADAATKNHKSQRPAGSAESEALLETVQFAISNLSISNQLISKPAQHHVLISCVENGVEIHSQGKLLLSVNIATGKNSLVLPIPTDVFVQMIAGIVRTVERIINGGKVESQRNDNDLTVRENGKNSVRIYGSGTMQLVRNAKFDSTTPKELTRFIISSLLDSENLDSNLLTLFSYVTRAISGFIPETTEPNSILVFELRTRLGWTFLSDDRSLVSDTQRYKMCGNAVTVNVVQAVITELATHCVLI